MEKRPEDPDGRNDAVCGAFAGQPHHDRERVTASATLEATPVQAVKGEAETSEKEGRGGDALKGGTCADTISGQGWENSWMSKASFSLRKSRWLMINFRHVLNMLKTCFSYFAH